MGATSMRLRHVISADQFDLPFLMELFKNAELFRDLFEKDHDDGRSRMRQLLEGKLLKYIFFEPSSRTRMSFEDGAIHLGMKVSGTDLADKFSSFAKHGEIEPEFRTMSGYRADVIVVRAKNVGEVERAAKYSRRPVINGGDGIGEHPTQAILDLYTIWLEYGRLDNLVIGLGGDLKYGRTVHSLIRCLSKFEGNKFILVSPAEMALPKKYKDILTERGCEFQEFTNVQDAMPLADFWYWTRVQFERIEVEEDRFEAISTTLGVSPGRYKTFDEKAREAHKADVLKLEQERLFEIAKLYAIGREELELMKDHAILMHPQPIDKRIREIRWEVVEQGMREFEDRDEVFKKVRIFEQSDNGLLVRMALIFWVVTGRHDTMLNLR